MNCNGKGESSRNFIGMIEKDSSRVLGRLLKDHLSKQKLFGRFCE